MIFARPLQDEQRDELKRLARPEVGRRFETWEKICHAVAEATAYGNKQCHPFIWGRRRRHHVHRPDIAALPQPA